MGRSGTSGRTKAVAQTPGGDKSLTPTAQEILLAGFIAIAAVDQMRFNEPFSLLLASAIITLALLGFLIKEHVTGSSLQLRNHLSLQLAFLVSWVLWSVLSLRDEHWQTSLTASGGFAIVLATSFVIIGRGGPIAAARTMWLSFVLHLLLGAILTKTSTETPFVANSLALASLEANQFARVAALGCIGALWFARECRSFGKSVVGATSAVGLLLVLATSSRTAVFALTVALSILVIHVSRRRVAALALGVLLVLAALTLSGFVGTGNSTTIAQVTSFSEGEALSFNGRSTLWPHVLTEISDSPIVGVGLGNDRPVIVQLPVGWGAQHAHSLPLHVALTTGLVGAFLLSAAVGVALVRSSTQLEPLAMALLFFVLIDGISEAVLRVPAFGWFALCAGVLLTSQSRVSDVQTIDLRELNTQQELTNDGELVNL